MKTNKQRATHYLELIDAIVNAKMEYNQMVSYFKSEIRCNIDKSASIDIKFDKEKMMRLYDEIDELFKRVNPKLITRILTDPSKRANKPLRHQLHTIFVDGNIDGLIRHLQEIAIKILMND